MPNSPARIAPMSMRMRFLRGAKTVGSSLWRDSNGIGLGPKSRRPPPMAMRSASRRRRRPVRGCRPEASSPSLARRDRRPDPPSSSVGDDFMRRLAGPPA